MSTVMSEPRSGRTSALQKALSGLLGLTLLAAALLPALDAAGGLPAVSRLEIAGEFRYLDTDQLRERLRPQLSGTLLSLDLDAVRAEAETLPWVARARVERLWPDAIRLSLVERVPFARWSAGSLLGEDGAIFTPVEKTLPDGLPQLSGPQGQQARVAQVYRELSASLATTDFAITSLELNTRGEWVARTASGVELRLGRGDPLQKATLITGAVTRALGARLAEIHYVDLRYSNGFAVGWVSPRDGPGVAATAEVSPGMAGQNQQRRAP